MEAVFKGQAVEHPDDHAGRHDHGTGALDEAPAAIPGGTQHIAGQRHMIGGQFQHEGRGLAGKHLEFFEDQARYHHGRHTHKIGGGGNPGGAAEESGCNRAHNGHFGAAGNETGGHDGHPPIPFLLNGTGGHDAGHAAAGSHQHGNEGFAGKAEFAEQAIHDEGDTGHIAAILQQGKQKEQNQHLGHKTKHRAHAADDTIGNQAHQPGCAANALQRRGYPGHNPFPKEGIIHEAHGPIADGADGDGIDQPHHRHKNRQGQEAIGDHPVNLIGNGEGALGLALFHAGGHQFTNIMIALIGDDGFGVIIHFGFAFGDHGFNRINDALGQIQFFLHLCIPLKQLDGIPAGQMFFHDSALMGAAIGMMMMDRFLAILMGDQILDMGQGMLHAASEYMGGLAMAALTGQLCRLLDDILAAGALESRGFHHFAAQCRPQLPQINHVPVFPGDIDHIQGDNHGNAQFGKLGGQIQIALNIGGVHDIEDGVRLFCNQIAAGYHFFHGIGGKAVNAGQILNDDVIGALQLAFLLFYRNAGPIAHILIGARQIIEHGGFPAIGVARQGNLDGHFVASYASLVSANSLSNKKGSFRNLISSEYFNHFRIGLAHG